MSDSERNSTSADLHRQCWLMLPWIVTGRIAASDKQRFERHLLDCAECRAELEQQRELCERIRRDEPIMLAPQCSLQKLMARIDASTPELSVQPEPAEAPHSGPVAPPIVATGARKSAPWLAIAAAVQTFAIAALMALIWQQREAEMNAPRFTTLSTAATPQPSGALLRVVFTPDMTNVEMQQLLRSVDATVVAGPSEAGVYSLRLKDGTSAQQVAAVLTSVRANPHVVFAENVSAEIKR